MILIGNYNYFIVIDVIIISKYHNLSYILNDNNTYLLTDIWDMKYLIFITDSEPKIDDAYRRCMILDSW